ncbi:MAG: hypothetical protein B7Y36_08270 [Novosphingobium sp. 28-62-57]|uniref:hypothetical protein n=1 Tax=unclassified Novosphingobium TaxID=2644732 RepID=UPI000BCC24EA|nr:MULTISPECIES: hypothetical protein [unclassified Novosphingobium]OYW47920.1 MAG: hypothetical protein B7Z36_01365 [Novosphingobium sp. 12-63-9]OYZ10811.1 MAG: hypothetical protein B7Y36_08270 [Novosphingobium sp. 28-62-57]OZA36951.1 MAG: hypothetical protein B7X92_05405 [Novosphingobium sp. 17-62-9]HQS69734.1 hypothetical protein [Novosphingobium sp.]
MAKTDNGSENAEAVAGDNAEFVDAAKGSDAAPTLGMDRIPELESALADAQEEIDQLGLQVTSLTKERDNAVAERDVALAKLAKIDAAPRTRTGKAKARKCGPLADAGLPAPHELLAEIQAADLVEIVFSNGKTEVGIPPILPSGKVWAVTPVGLQLRVPELPVEGPMAGPVKLAGYGLFLNGEQVAWGPRADVLDVMPGRKMDMRHDVVFPAG